MPRPKNNTLRKLFCHSNNSTVVACSNGKCGGRKLSDRAGNLERHLRIMHPPLYASYMAQKGITSVRRVESDTHIIRISCDVNKRNIKRAIVELFTKSGLPLRLIEDRAIKMLLKPVFDALRLNANVTTIIEKISSHSEKVKEEIIEDFKEKLFSMKIDLAAKEKLYVLGVSVQYVKNNSLKVQTLAIKQFAEKQTVEIVMPLLLEVLDEYEIDINQIMTITTDNGKDMIRANGEENSDDGASEDILDLTSTVLSSPGITSIRCGAHTLNLCVREVINMEEISQNIDKWRSVVVKLGSVNHLGILHKCGYKAPSLDCQTRWDTTYDMFEKLIELKDVIKAASMSPTSDFAINNDDWNFIESFLDAVKVIRNAVLKLQFDILGYSDFYIVIMETILKVGNVSRSNVQTALFEALNREKLKLMESDLFISAVFLDPRVKLTLTPGQIVRAKHFIGLLHERITALRESAPNLERNQGKPEAASSTTHLPQTLDELLQSLDGTSKSSTPVFLKPSEVPIKMEDDEPSSSSQVTEPCDEFLPMQNIEIDMLVYDHQQRMPLTENVFEFWGKQKNSLSGVAECILAIPCSQDSMERMHSAMEYILSEDCTNLSSQQLENILLLKVNDNVFNYE